MPLHMFTQKDAKPKHIIAIAAGKGGVGKSSLTVNLALALKNLGFSVGIMDADIYGPSIRKMLPEGSLPIQNEEGITPAICDGIRMISMAYFRKEHEAAAVRSPIVNGIITQFIKDVDWGELDYLLIDFPPGTGDIQLTISQKVKLSGAIIITTPQEVSLIDVRKAIHLFHQVNVPLIGIVENMSYYFHEKTNEALYLFGKGGGEKLAQESGAPLLGTIPLYPEICHCGDEGKSIFSTTSDATKTFVQLAEKVIFQTKQLENSLFPQISQKDPFSITIQWNEKQSTTFSLCELQKKCPCANCVDENTGKRLISEETIDSKLEAKDTFKVGRYGIRILFQSGCTTGIFSYDYLAQLSGEKHV